MAAVMQCFRRALTNVELQAGFKQCRGLCSSRKTITNSDVRRKRNELFEKEKNRQRALITRVEKIKVQYTGLPEECTLLMNRGLSTPFNCAMHIGELFLQQSVVALVNGVAWDMHRPLLDDCTLKFLHFKEDDPSLPNQVFWRTGSVLLGHILESAFKDEYYVELCSFPRPNVQSGSFVYDVDLKVPDWQPSSSELRCLGQIGRKLQYENVRFERLDVDATVAAEMFADNRFKSEQIPQIAAQSTSQSEVTLYRMGSHVEITRGPLMSGTHLLGRFDVTAVHDIESPDFGPMKRVQGIAIPSQLSLHYWTYEKLVDRGAALNNAALPGLQQKGSVRQANGGFK